MICRGIFAKSHVKDILGYCCLHMTSEVHDNPEAYIHWLYINTKRDRKKNDANLVCRASNNNVSILLFKRDIFIIIYRNVRRFPSTTPTSPVIYMI
jgi:hypothetical protein